MVTTPWLHYDQTLSFFVKGMTCLQDYMYVPEVEARQTLSSSLPSVQGSSHSSSDEEEGEEEEVRARSRKISPGLYAPDPFPSHSVMNFLFQFRNWMLCDYSRA